MTQADAADAGRSGSSPAERSPRRSPDGRGGLLSRLTRFVREVVAELRKVVRPSRHELLTYTAVVLVFVVIVMLYVSGLDYVFGQAVLWVFGG